MGAVVDRHAAGADHARQVAAYDQRGALVEADAEQQLDARIVELIRRELHEQAGFHLDSSLAFADHEGFRHATCLPFRCYDADANRPHDVSEMPLAVMDTTVFRYRGLDFDEAMQQTGRILNAAQRFGGVAVLLWHNLLYDALDFPGWDRHFEQTLHHGAREKARMCSLKDAFEVFLK